MKVRVREIEAKTILTPQKWGSLHPRYDYSLNPYAGCAFGCSYCYVPKFPNARHEYFEWGTWVDVKMNAPELIARERLKVFASRIFFSSATDPYQYLELKYRLSRRCLQELLKYGPELVTMHTRSHLIRQDLDLLKAFGDTLQVGISITTDNETVRQEFEPSAPSLRRRLELLRALRQAGIEVYASLSPLLPCDPDRLARLLKPFVGRVWADRMRYPEINTRRHLLKKYSWFFEDRNYDSALSTIESEFANRSNWCRDALQAHAAQAVPQPVQLQLNLAFNQS